MGQMHELLAVEPDLAGLANKLVEERKKTFNKPEHFIGTHRHLRMFDASEQEKVVADEYKEQVTTVMAQLRYLADGLTRYWDAVLQKEKTNQVAVADLVVDGQTLGTNLPAGFLLGLENKLKELRSVYETIPTLGPGIAWEKDGTLEDSYRMKNPEETVKTELTVKHKILYEATDRHPAQIEKWQEQVPVGKYVKNVTSGMLSPAQKSAVLARYDKLIQAVKKARQRANKVEIAEDAIAAKLFAYVHGEGA